MRSNTTQVLANMITCTMLNRQGEPCGQPGEEGLPAGVCPAHAAEVWRAVTRMIDARRAQEAGK